MISKILVALFILVLLLIVMLLYFFISDEKKRNILSENNNGSLDEQSDSDAEPETLYNEAPIHWLKLPYKRAMMPNIIHPNDDSTIYKNIVILEHSFAFQKILIDYVGD